MRIKYGLIVLLLAAGAPALADDDGEQLFVQHCAYCHDRNLPRMPSRAGLRERDPRDVFSTISAGGFIPDSFSKWPPLLRSRELPRAICAKTGSNPSICAVIRRPVMN